MKFENNIQLYTIIGTQIKSHRKKSNLTQAQLATRATISISYLSKIEVANCPKGLSLSVLNRIANALNVDIDIFLIMAIMCR